ncbi:biotin/lipoyl-containing protein [Aromatoleum diolicum]|nr:biotin/lipoyl-containing protein [Aromatoleum diolicum]
MPKYPECWDSCGNCRTGEVFVQSVLVCAGETVKFDDTLIVLETGKVALDIPCPHSGTVVEMKVDEGEPIDQGELIALVEVD